MTIHRRPTPTISTNQITHGHQNRLVAFLISGWGISHFFTNTQNTQPRGLKKRKINNRTWVSSKCRREVCDTFVQLSVHFAGYCEGVFALNSRKPQGMLTNLLTLVNPASVGHQVLAATFLTSVDWTPL